MKLIENINHLSKKEFINKFGNIFEKSNWIASEVFIMRPFKNSRDLLNKMINIYDITSKKKIIKIFNLHPELAIEKKLTKFSLREQAGAQLNKCTKEELEEFNQLNLKYKKKFKFPYIIAVKGKNKKEILNNFRSRIKNNHEIEFNEAKLQVRKIASIRLNDILNIS